VPEAIDMNQNFGKSAEPCTAGPRSIRQSTSDNTVIKPVSARSGTATKRAFFGCWYRYQTAFRVVGRRYQTGSRGTQYRYQSVFSAETRLNLYQFEHEVSPLPNRFLRTPVPLPNGVFDGDEAQVQNRPWPPRANAVSHRYQTGFCGSRYRYQSGLSTKTGPIAIVIANELDSSTAMRHRYQTGFRRSSVP
jgi:hypothetical protein